MIDERATVRLDEVYFGALERHDAAQRAAYLDEACGADAGLREKVERLLKAREDRGDFLQVPACPPTLDASAFSDPIGRSIGPYRLLECIGEGGMGTVYLAEQTQPVRRMVAVKVIKPGMDSRQILSRFAAEAQALALMDHSNIAKVLDAGSTEQGRPYFVMDLVRGVPITKYCDDQRLSTRERLELFIPVCQAVQHAHQKGIIHRDIKPSNVLVALYDSKPVPKVIDFGVAKATGQKLTETSLFTGFGTLVGTPEYMSPEQAGLSQLDIDTRSDIYSLGVMLYELLTGTTPLQRARLEQAALAEVLRVIREEDPQRPSTRLSTADELPSIAANRGVEPHKLTNLVRGDLDWIVMKALEKDRSRRFATANDLATDLVHFLSDEPVRACPPTFAYRLKKFARRHKGALAAASMVVITLVVGMAVSTWQALRATRAERAAQHERMLAEQNFGRARRAVDRFFTVVSEETLIDTPGLQPLRERLLDEARRFYEELRAQRRHDPALQADLAKAYMRMGEVYVATGKAKEFVAMFQTGLDLVDELMASHPNSAEAHQQLAGFWRGHRRLHLSMPGASIRDQAVQILTRGARAWQQLAESFPSIPAFRSDLAAIYTHISELYYDQPEELLRWQSKALNIRQELVAANGSLDRYREDLATSLLIMGIFHERSGRGNESRTFLREAVAQSRRLLNGTPKSSVYREFLAQTTRFLMNSEPAPERERLCRESRQLFEDLFSEYPTVPLYMHGCALLSLSFAGIVGPKSPTEAEAAYRRSLELSRRLISESPENGDYRWMLRTSASELAQWLANNGRPAEAVAVCRDRINAFKAIQSSRADDSPLQLQVHRELGWAYGQLAWILELDKQESDANVARRDSLAEWEICLATTAPRPEDVHGYSEALHLVPKPGETPVERVSRFERCVDLEQKALAARPSDKDYRQLQGYHYWALGGAYEAVGDDKKAGEALRHSIELWESLANPPEYLPKVRDQHARIQLRTEHAKEAPGASTKEEPMKHE